MIDPSTHRVEAHGAGPKRSSTPPFAQKSKPTDVVKVSHGPVRSVKTEPMPKRRRDLAEWRRQLIIDAALEVFGKKGIDGASMKDVAAAAGIASGLIYHYFASKEALSLAVTVERGFLQELCDLLIGAQQRPAAIVLPEVTSGFDRLLSERPGLVGLFISGVLNPTMKGGLEEIMQETHRLLGKYLTDRVAVGELRPHDTRAAVQALFCSCAFGHMIGQRIDPVAVAQIVLRGIEVG